MRIAATLAVAALLTLSQVSLGAWGLDVHRLITRRAAEGLPEPLKAFYMARIDVFTEHSVDPDMWRVVNLRSAWGEEDPNHFLDIDGLDDPRPFANVPREWDAYVARYGAERANKMGRLPWRADEIYQLLVARFSEAAKNPAGYAGENAVYLSSVLAHYLEDAHQPFHGVANYDGQLTNQRGIHSRFETELVERNRTALNLAPVTIRPIRNIRDFIFDRLIEDEALVAGILAADTRAADGREFYDDAYFAELWKGTRPVVERRLSEASSAVASAIVAAWTAGGKPSLPVKRLSAPVRIRR